MQSSRLCKKFTVYGIECRVPYLDYDLAGSSFKTK